MLNSHLCSVFMQHAIMTFSPRFRGCFCGFHSFSRLFCLYWILSHKLTVCNSFSTV